MRYRAALAALALAALGEPAPRYAHLPLLHGPDGKKLSKRHGAASVGELRDAGYLPAAVRNYLALLGWGDRHSPPSPDGPPMLIVHKECGGPVSDRGICEECGQELHARDARSIPGPGVEALALAAPAKTT